MLDDEQHPDYRYMDAAVASIAPGIHAGSLVIFETTLPVGDTRGRYVPRLETASGLTVEGDFFVAFSPERLYSGAALRNLATYPKLVGGIGAASGERAARFYASVLDAEVVRMSVGRGGRVQQARRYHVPRREHRAGQRVRPLRRPGRRRHPGGHRGRQQPALQPHPPAGRRASAATASRSTRISSCRAHPRWSSSRSRGG